MRRASDDYTIEGLTAVAMIGHLIEDAPMKKALLMCILALTTACGGPARPATSGDAGKTVGAARTQTDAIPTDAGELGITPIKHASMMMTFGGKHFFFDPWKEGNFDGLPKADVVFITDIHPDHYDPEA